MKRPDLLLLIAVWEFITIVGALIGIGALVIFAFPPIGWLVGAQKIALIFGVSIAIPILLGYIAVAIVGGVGLLRGKNWGRILSIAHSGASLLFLPIGTIIGVLIIIYLVKEPVAAYFTERQPTS